MPVYSTLWATDENHRCTIPTLAWSRYIVRQQLRQWAQKNERNMGKVYSQHRKYVEVKQRQESKIEHRAFKKLKPHYRSDLMKESFFINSNTKEIQKWLHSVILIYSWDVYICVCLYVCNYVCEVLLDGCI